MALLCEGKAAEQTAPTGAWKLDWQLTHGHGFFIFIFAFCLFLKFHHILLNFTTICVSPISETISIRRSSGFFYFWVHFVCLVLFVCFCDRRFQWTAESDFETSFFMKRCYIFLNFNRFRFLFNGKRSRFVARPHPFNFQFKRFSLSLVFIAMLNGSVNQISSVLSSNSITSSWNWIMCVIPIENDHAPSLARIFLFFNLILFLFFFFFIFYHHFNRIVEWGFGSRNRMGN